MDLSDLLTQNGYHRIRLERSGVGHFETDGQLKGRTISILIDTGASSTILDLSRAVEWAFVLEELPFQGGSAGAAKMEVYGISDAQLVIQGANIQVPQLMAMGLDHVNAALSSKGQRGIVLIVGADVFEKHAVVIDYATRSLYLRAAS